MSAATNTTAKKTRRRIEGIVLSNRMQKTVVVQTTTLVKHPKYGKYFRKYKKFKAHDEGGKCQQGDRVEVIESRPISKEKKFRVVRVIEKSKPVGALEITEEKIPGSESKSEVS